MTVTVSMSAVSLKITTLLFLFFKDSHGLQLKAITIQCRCPDQDQDSLTVMKNDNEKLIVWKKNDPNSNDQNGLEVKGKFPNMDIVIKNLAPNDEGPYWCFYQRLNTISQNHMTTNATMSLLLVQEAFPSKQVQDECNRSKDDLILLSVMISVAVILSIIMSVLIWLIKTKTGNPTKKPRCVLNNGVYEDMRGTHAYQSVYNITN
ncbi:hypothetical protein EXN66_Car015948 [Channa argus]|uniref:Ig-like domain-containing protein n=1 Tax=Channa argus TaxID=215402 RepID=A0A6G1QC87_CHAAH|nr:hypothetical protein EXN66_Car015948 [Channa argus]